MHNAREIILLSKRVDLGQGHLCKIIVMIYKHTKNIISLRFKSCKRSTKKKRFSWTPYFLWYFRSEFVYSYLCLAECVRAKSQSRDPVHEQRCQTYHNSFRWKWLGLLVTPSQQTSNIFKRRTMLYLSRNLCYHSKNNNKVEGENIVLLSHPHGLCVNTMKSGSVVLSTKVMHV